MKLQACSCSKKVRMEWCSKSCKIYPLKDYFCDSKCLSRENSESRFYFFTHTEKY